jgi:signal transduction histidine kinase
VETDLHNNSQNSDLAEDLHNLEAYMEEFTSFLPLAVCIINSNEVIVEVNEAFTRVSHFSQNESTGKLLSDYFIEKDQLNILLELVDKMPGGGAEEKQLTMKTKDAKTKKVVVTVGPRRDTSNELTGYYVGISPVLIDPPAAPDKTKKIDVESKQQSNDGDVPDVTCVGTAAYEHQKTLAIIDGMRNGLLVIDDEGRIDTINAHAADVLSVDRSKICGESIDSLSDRTELSELLTLINANPGEPKKIKIDKQTFEVDVEVAQTEDGKNYTLVMLHDITKDEFIEDMKLTFVTVAAHQIRTPLSSIRWSLEILASQIKDEEQKKIAQRGYRSTQNMLEIVNALLNLDRLQSGQDGYNFESIDIVAMIDEYADEARANKRIIEQADIIFNPPQGSLPKVKADKEKLKIVIRNLIDNALKYTPTDGTVNIDASVHVTNDYGSDMVQIQIADDGIGIPPDSQDKIFSKFYRADNATKVKTDGTGIGLYISKQIIDEHDGTIWFESKEGEGTTFYIQLPIAQIQD